MYCAYVLCVVIEIQQSGGVRKYFLQPKTHSFVIGQKVYCEWDNLNDRMCTVPASDLCVVMLLQLGIFCNQNSQFCDRTASVL